MAEERKTAEKRGADTKLPLPSIVAELLHTMDQANEERSSAHVDDDPLTFLTAVAQSSLGGGLPPNTSRSSY